MLWPDKCVTSASLAPRYELLANDALYNLAHRVLRGGIPLIRPRRAVRLHIRVEMHPRSAVLFEAPHRVRVNSLRRVTEVRQHYQTAVNARVLRTTPLDP